MLEPVALHGIPVFLHIDLDTSAASGERSGNDKGMVKTGILVPGTKKGTVVERFRAQFDPGSSKSNHKQLQKLSSNSFRTLKAHKEQISLPCSLGAGTSSLRSTCAPGTRAGPTACNHLYWLNS